SQGGPNPGAANFQADWDQEYVDWLDSVRSAFVTDSTTMAGDDAPYQETVAGIGDDLANKVATADVTFTQSDAPAAATEADQLDAADDGYSVSVVDHLGDDA